MKNKDLEKEGLMDLLVNDKYIKLYKNEVEKLKLEYTNILDLYFDSSFKTKVDKDILCDIFNLLKEELTVELESFWSTYTQDNVSVLLSSDINFKNKSVLNDDLFKKKGISINPNSSLHLNSILNKKTSKIKALSIMLSGLVSTDKIKPVEQESKKIFYYLVRGYWVNSQGDTIRDVRVQLNFKYKTDSGTIENNIIKLENKIRDVLNDFDYEFSKDLLINVYTLKRKESNQILYLKSITEEQMLYRLLIFASQYKRYKSEF